MLFRGLLRLMLAKHCVFNTSSVPLVTNVSGRETLAGFGFLEISIKYHKRKHHTKSIKSLDSFWSKISPFFLQISQNNFLYPLRFTKTDCLSEVNFHNFKLGSVIL